MIVLWLLSGEVKGENMAKSQIIIDVVEGNVSLTQSLNRLLVLSKDINNISDLVPNRTYAIDDNKINSNIQSDGLIRQ